MTVKTLTALPVYNEGAHILGVLEGALCYSREVLVVDDGSSDATPQILAAQKDIHVIRHPQNLGYGAALRSAFRFALDNKYDTLVTIDCDGQHQPQMIPAFVRAAATADVVSGSRYLRRFPGDSEPPPDRRRINQIITEELNRRLGFRLTDAFCGFKAYRVEALRNVEITETGYAMPIEFWVQAAALGLSIVELAVPLIYLDESRSFGGAMDNAEVRLAVYRQVLERCLSQPVSLGVGSRAASACRR